MKPLSDSDSPWPSLRKRFSPTRWSLVRRVTKGSGGRETDASDFCGLYWQPLYSFLRSRGHDSENARDHVQTFFVKVINRDWLRTVNNIH